MVSASRIALTALECIDLFVLESHRGAGVGKALFGHLGKLCRERDCGRLDWSVLRVGGRPQVVEHS